MTLSLRPYQDRFVSDLRAAYGEGARSVLGVMPTGSGKTVCFSYMAQQAHAKGLRVGLVAHRVEILDQIGRALTAWDVPHGYITPGRPLDPLARVHVASVFSLARRVERLRARPYDLLIVDEAHHAAVGSSWHQVVDVHRRAGRRILGVTATPRRLSGEPLAPSFDRMVIGPTTAELIDLKALSPYRAFAPATPDLEGVGRRMGDYIKSELDKAMDKPTITGDAVGNYLKWARGKRALAFCVSIAHAEHVAASFRASGVEAQAIDGKMSRADRAAAIAAFEAGRTLVLTSCDLVSEGFDLPAIEAAILLRPTQSLALHLQQVGRALRIYPGKSHALILDHADNLARHGLPDDPQDWTLEGAVKKRGGAGGAPPLPIRTCASCFGVFRPAPVCPHCGVAAEVEGRQVREVEGELDELDLDRVRREKRQEVGRAGSLEALIKLGVERGYKNPRAWAGYILTVRAARGRR